MSDEFDKWWGSTAPVSGGQPPTFDTWWNEAPQVASEPLPGDPFAGDWSVGMQAGTAPQGVVRRLPGAIGGVDMMGQWLNQNPGDAAQMLISGAGAAAGAPAGPPGMVIGGALGNLAGRIVGNTIEGRPAPTLEEGAWDAGIGAVLGGVGPATNAVTKPVVRAVMGGRYNVQAVSRASDKAYSAEYNSMLDEYLKANPAKNARDVEAFFAPELDEAAERAAQFAAREATRRTTSVSGPEGTGAAAALLAGGGDITGASAAFLGLRALTGSRRLLARRMLENPDVRKWALQSGAAFGTPAQAAASFAALAATDWLSPDEREAALDIKAGLLSNTLGGRMNLGGPKEPEPRIRYGGRNGTTAYTVDEQGRFSGRAD